MSQLIGNRVVHSEKLTPACNLNENPQTHRVDRTHSFLATSRSHDDVFIQDMFMPQPLKCLCCLCANSIAQLYPASVYIYICFKLYSSVLLWLDYVSVLLYLPAETDEANCTLNEDRVSLVVQNMLS